MDRDIFAVGVEHGHWTNTRRVASKIVCQPLHSTRVNCLLDERVSGVPEEPELHLKIYLRMSRSPLTFLVDEVGAFEVETDIFVSAKGYFNGISLDHMKKFKSNAFVENTGHLNNKIGMAGSKGLDGTRIDNIKPQELE